MRATYAVFLPEGEEKNGLPARMAFGAFLAGSMAFAVVGGLVFVPSDTSPAVALPADRTELASPTRPRTRDGERDQIRWPAEGAEAAAERIATQRTGVVSFAALGPDEATAGLESSRQFYSASVSKAMLLVAELRRLRRAETALDDETRSLLEQMITISDNDAADAIYARVGDAGLNEVAEVTGMTGFEGDVGHWSNVRITARDMAFFMASLDELLDLPHGEVGLELLGSVTPTQRWGVPQAAPDGSVVRLKGGWRPSETGNLVHQTARLDVGGETYAVAVLTDGNPTQVYGEETIRRIAAALFRRVPGSE